MTEPDQGMAESDGRAPNDRVVDARAVRVSLAPSSAHAGLAPIVVEPRAVPIDRTGDVPATAERVGEPAARSVPSLATPGDGQALIDGEPAGVRFDRLGASHGVMREETDGVEPTRTQVVILPPDGLGQLPRIGATRREVIVDGWRIEVEVESERRASLREKARRGSRATVDGGTTEVRAIIPGVVASVSVVPGDAVVAGHQLLVVEAMKMQNELRAPRDAVVSRVAVGVGQTIEVGDLLLVLD